MPIFKKKYILEKDIVKFEIKDIVANKVDNFYTEAPFPNYQIEDNKYIINKKGDNNFLARNFKKFIGFNKTVLEVGCGTGQLANYFAIGTNNKVVGLDSTNYSLQLASRFSKKEGIKNITFVNADILDDVLKDDVFDFIWCNGVLHHTKNPYAAFEILLKSLKKNGYLLVGLYNKYGRLRTLIRRFLYKIFGERAIYLLDPVIRKIKKKSKEQTRSWIRDQYIHPVESMHTFDEVLNWFNKNEIEYINALPSFDFETSFEIDLFKKANIGNIFTRFFNQILMIFNSYGNDGGLFIVIGKKKDV